MRLLMIPGLPVNDDALPQPQATNHDSGSVASGRPKEIQEALVNLHPL